MMRTVESPLEGANMWYGTADHHAAARKAESVGKNYAGDMYEYAESQTMVRGLALGHGAELICSDDPVPVTSGERNYRIDPPRQFRAVMARFFANNPNLDLEAPRLNIQRYGDMDEVAVTRLAALLDAGEKRVFAYTGRDRGLAKYLIDSSVQLEKIEALRRNTTVDFANHFEVRPFVETPSDRYTSYRTLVAPTGETIAASLLYSAHTKQENLKIIEDRPWDDDEVLKTFRAQLEDPSSKYFLDAINIRSNVATGGKLIPLMGDSDYWPDSVEREILEAHALNPDAPEVPRDIASTSKTIGKLLGPQIGIVMGLDFIASSSTATRHLLEVNAGPGAGTYARCWTQKQASSFKAMWGHAFESLVLGSE